MIQLTETASTAVRTAMSKADNPVAGLRILVEAGGCAGMKYSLGLVAEGKPEDIIVEQTGFKVFVDPSSVPMLQGTTIDFVVNLEGSGFTFENPQAQSRCSCGKSFH